MWVGGGGVGGLAGDMGDRDFIRKHPSEIPQCVENILFSLGRKNPAANHML